MKVLTKEQSELAEKNHKLIYEFANRKRLLLDDYYDILAIGLCNASMIYDKNKGEFSTLAYNCMENELKMYWRHITKKSSVPDKMILSYDNLFYNDEGEKVLYEELIDNKGINDCQLENTFASLLIDLLTDKEKKIVSFLICGMSQNEIAKQLKCKQQNINYFVNQIRKKWTPYLI